MCTLLITGSQVKAILSMKETIEVVEEAFKAKSTGNVQMPPKLYLFYRKYDGDLRVMPSYLEGLDLTGVKIVNVHPHNPEKFGMPSVMAMIVLIDPKNGLPYAIMDGTWITAMRTGAAGGIAVKYLARKDSKTAGCVGSGRQALTQLMALKEFLNLERVCVWSHDPQSLATFIEETKYMGITIKPVNRIEDAVKGMDIVTTTTPVTEPLVKAEWISDGTHINAIGADAPGKEELEPVILKKAKVVIDDWEQAFHSGEINVPLSKGIITQSDIYAELGDVVANKKEGRTSSEEITIFDSTGLSIQDISTADLVYRKAKEAKVGTEFELIDMGK